MNKSLKCLFIHRSAPHGSLRAWESLEVAMITAAYEHRVSLLFTDDGVFQLLADQQSDDTGTRNFSRVFGALADYGVEQIYVEQSALVERGLGVDDLLMPVQVLSTDAIKTLIGEQDILQCD